MESLYTCIWETLFLLHCVDLDALQLYSSPLTGLKHATNWTVASGHYTPVITAHLKQMN